MVTLKKSWVRLCCRALLENYYLWFSWCMLGKQVIFVNLRSMSRKTIEIRLLRVSMTLFFEWGEEQMGFGERTKTYYFFLIVMGLFQNFKDDNLMIGYGQLELLFFSDFSLWSQWALGEGHSLWCPLQEVTEASCSQGHFTASQPHWLPFMEHIWVWHPTHKTINMSMAKIFIKQK